MLHALGIDLAVSQGNDSWPCNGKPIGVDAEFFKQRYVFWVSVVFVAGHLAGGMIFDSTGNRTESIPDGWRAPVFVNGTFDLVRGCRHPPCEIFRKNECHNQAPHELWKVKTLRPA